MWYARGHENPHFYPSNNRRRTTSDPGGIAFVRCLCLAPRPYPAGLSAPRTSATDRTPTGLRRPGGAQCDPWLQCLRSQRAVPRIFAPPSAAHLVHARRTGAIARPLASQPTRIWQRTWHLDVGTGCPSVLGARHYRRADFRLGVLTNHISLFPKRSHEYGPGLFIGEEKEAIPWQIRISLPS
jgi:hypothetical protein